MVIWVIGHVDEGDLAYGTSFKAAKQYLLDSGRVIEEESIYVEELGHSEYLVDLYGENWKKMFLQFDYKDLENMDFYVREQEVAEEKN